MVPEAPKRHRFLWLRSGAISASSTCPSGSKLKGFRSSRWRILANHRFCSLSST